MSLRLALAAAAALALASPAAATLAAPPAVQGAEAALTEADLDAASDAFEARMEAMGAELETVVSANMGDTARLDAEVSAVLARYSPDIEAFASQLQTFLTQQAAAAETPQEAQALNSAATAAGAAIRSIPGQVRAGIAEGMAEASAAAASTGAETSQ